MKTVPELNTLHWIEQSYYPGQKNWDNRAHVAQARDLSSMHRLCLALRGCLNFFGQGSRYTSTYRKNASTESLAKNNDVGPNILMISSQPPRERKRERERERERERGQFRATRGFLCWVSRARTYVHENHTSLRMSWAALTFLFCRDLSGPHHQWTTPGKNKKKIL